MSTLTDEDEVTIAFNVDREYELTLDVVSMAKVLGISKARLKRIVDGEDDNEYEPNDAVQKRLISRGELTTDAFEVQEITQSF